MKAFLTRRYRFSASHRLHSIEFSEEENRNIYGKCSNPHGHGHNYKLEVTVSGVPDPVTGMVCNLSDLDGCVDRAVLSTVHLANLNELPVFHKLVPTTENLSRYLLHLLREQFLHATVEKVRIEETMMNSFEHAGASPMESSATREQR